jgi:prenylcysteine alpha-carboxyl methylesterase
MEGEESLSRYSPEIVAKTSSAETIALLPLIVLMHGTEDYSIPSSARLVHILFIDVCLGEGQKSSKPRVLVDMISLCLSCCCVEMKLYDGPNTLALEFDKSNFPTDA